MQVSQIVVSHCRAKYRSALRMLSRPAIMADRRAITAVEYAIIAGIMVFAIVISVPTIGPSLANIFSAVAQKL